MKRGEGTGLHPDAFRNRQMKERKEPMADSVGRPYDDASSASTESGVNLSEPVPVLETHVEWMTPARAAELLADTGRTTNRPVRDWIVKVYADDMRLGRWLGEPTIIRLDRNGHLYDGQHRLTAVIRANVMLPVEIRTLDGEARDLITTIDTGLRRSSGDTLSVLGHGDGARLSAIIKRIVGLQAGRPRSNAGMSTTAQLGFIEQFGHVKDSLRPSRLPWPGHGGMGGMTAAWAGALYFEFGRVYGVTDMRDGFFERLAHGTGLRDGEPVAVLRAQLVNQMNMKNAKLSWKEQRAIAWTIYAYQDVLDGRSRKTYGWKADSHSFPWPPVDDRRRRAA